MANFNAETIVSPAPFASGAGRGAVPVEQFVTSISLQEATRGSASARLVAYVETVFRRRLYKLRATCSASPTGYITWVNSTGDDAGKPACAGTLGPTQIVSSWLQTSGGR